MMPTNSSGPLRLCRAVGCLALAALLGCSGSDAICEVPAASGTTTVGIRPIGPQTTELVKHTSEGTQTIATLTGQSATTWFAAEIHENEALYGWVGTVKPETRQYPQWLRASDREPLEPTLCQDGQHTFSVVVATGAVILIQQSDETVLELPPTGGLMGRVSMFEDPAHN